MHEFEQIKLKYIAEIFNGNSIPDELKNNYVGKSIPYIPTKELSVEDGAINYDNGLSVSETDGFRIAPSESVLMCIEGGSAGKKIGFTDRPVAFVNKLCCIHGKTAFPKILYHALRSKDFTDQFFLNMTGLIGGVTVSVLKNLTITIPKSISEQQAIADILDRKCTQIDALIANEEQQIAKLKAYKQSVITETVTKGLNPDVPMKDSGVEWIGEIPEQWNVIRNNVIFKNVSIKNHGKDMVLSLYRDLGIVPKDSRDDNHNVTSLDTDSYKYVVAGDLVINKMKAWSGSVAVSNYSGIVSPAYYVCKINYDYVTKRFIHHYLRNKMIVGVYEMLSAGMRIGQWDLGIDDFLRIEIAIPPIEEQQQIADYLDKRCEQIDRLIAIKQQKIEKIQQYKKSVIYEYVTGKREV